MAPLVTAMLLLAGCANGPVAAEVSGPLELPAASGPADEAAVAAARDFLDTYTDPDGRVVRRDQGGDTVSEGQAYGMLLAVAADDQATFDRIWGWTRETMLRPDGLLSWHWADGALVNTDSAADADLDAARALVLAGVRFSDDGLAEDGRRLATAILDHETVETPVGRVLTAGTWTLDAPWTVNPSYFSPQAAAELATATGDERWARVSAAGSTVTGALLDATPVPPDWARLDGSGAVAASASPQGGVPGFSYDAARVVLRNAESCSAADRALAARAGEFLDVPVAQVRGAYALDGTPTVPWQGPLALAASAAAHSAAGDPASAATALDAAQLAEEGEPGYYGAAWVALGRVFLQTGLLGSCAAS